jgi:hypothetical protein
MIPREFLIERQGKTFALFAGLLDAAHRDGLRRISTEVIQFGNDANGQTWIVRAEVETSRGTFSGIGDASPANVSRQMATCLPRMAKTRSKARALRDAINAGALVALEELADVDHADALEQASPQPAPVKAKTTASSSAPQASTTDAPGEVATPDQRRAIENLAKSRGVNLTRAGIDLSTLTKAAAGQLIARWGQEAKATA